MMMMMMMMMNDDDDKGEVLVFDASAISYHHYSLGSEWPREHHPATARDQGGER
jgi:hypothetical protein